MFAFSPFWFVMAKFCAQFDNSKNVEAVGHEESSKNRRRKGQTATMGKGWDELDQSIIKGELIELAYLLRNSKIIKNLIFSYPDQSTRCEPNNNNAREHRAALQYEK